MKNVRKAFIPIILLILVCPNLFAQEDAGSSGFDIGADVVSRYVWRGIDFGTSVNIQPKLTYSIGGFSAGFWGSYPFAYESIGSDESDIWVSYTLSGSAGSFTPCLYDYYCPNAGLEFGAFHDHNAGAHTAEFSLLYSGPENLPVYFLGAINVYNDTSNSSYFELGFSKSLSDVSISPFIGVAIGPTKWYGVDGEGPQVINLGLKASKEIKFTEKFTAPIGVSFILNPHTEKSFIVFSFSI